MGGRRDQGAVRPEADEPLFHADWERRALGLTLAMGATGQWNIDMSRAARESIGAERYLRSSYYEIWLAGMERLLLARGLVDAEELQLGRTLQPGRPVARVLRAGDVDAVLAKGSPTGRPVTTPARFSTGQRVRTRCLPAAGHTRLPAYVQGHVGTVMALHGMHIYPDRHAVAAADGGFDESPQWLYTVSFTGAELWGDAGEAGIQVSVEAFEPYLEAA